MRRCLPACLSVCLPPCLSVCLPVSLCLSLSAVITNLASFPLVSWTPADWTLPKEGH